MMVQDDVYDGIRGKSWKDDGGREGESGERWEKRKEKKEKKRRIQLGGGTLKYLCEGSFGADG